MASDGRQGRRLRLLRRHGRDPGRRLAIPLRSAAPICAARAFRLHGERPVQLRRVRRSRDESRGLPSPKASAIPASRTTLPKREGRLGGAGIRPGNGRHGLLPVAPQRDGSLGSSTGINLWRRGQGGSGTRPRPRCRDHALRRRQQVPLAALQRRLAERARPRDSRRIASLATGIPVLGPCIRISLQIRSKHGCTSGRRIPDRLPRAAGRRRQGLAAWKSTAPSAPRPPTISFARLKDAEEAEGRPAWSCGMDTPGGLDKSMRDMIKALLARFEYVPVATYRRTERRPGGQRRHLHHVREPHRAMAPATNIGSSTPVSIGGGGSPLPFPIRPSRRTTKRRTKRRMSRQPRRARPWNGKSSTTPQPTSAASPSCAGATSSGPRRRFAKPRICRPTKRWSLGS